jgi:hypothetical protein
MEGVSHIFHKLASKLDQPPSSSPKCHADLPVKVQSSTLLGDIRSRTTHCVRDNGFQGRIGDHVIISYGDTIFRNKSYKSEWLGMTSDSVALATSNPLEVEDVNLDSKGWPEQFCQLNPRWHKENPGDDAMGITNVVETTPGKGVLFFLKNHRPGGKNTIIGAGVAIITMEGKKPKARRISEYWWDSKTEPFYGDVCALRAGDHIYAYGHGPNGSPFVHVCRVHHLSATDLTAYEYWNGKTWQKERLHNPGETGKIFWQVQQGQVIWSNYYDCFMFVFSSKLNHFTRTRIENRKSKINISDALSQTTSWTTKSSQ